MKWNVELTVEPISKKHLAGLVLEHYGLNKFDEII